MDPITTEFVLSTIKYLQIVAFQKQEDDIVDLFSYVHSMKSYRKRLKFMQNMNVVLSLTDWLVGKIKDIIPGGMEIEYVVSCYVLCIKYLLDDSVDQALFFSVKLSSKIFDLHLSPYNNPFSDISRKHLNDFKRIEIKVLEKIDYTLPCTNDYKVRCCKLYSYDSE
jgi:hypothetical protein